MCTSIFVKIINIFLKSSNFIYLYVLNVYNVKNNQLLLIFLLITLNNLSCIVVMYLP